MRTTSRAPARIVAVIALAVAVIALLAIISSNQGSEDASQGARNATDQQAERKVRPRRAVYTVKDGDTLLGIAAKTGVDIARLEDLNPEIDPQRLIAGQRIKLR